MGLGLGYLLRIAVILYAFTAVVGAPDRLDLILHGAAGDPVPGNPGPSSLRILRSARQNDLGQTVFIADIRTPRGHTASASGWGVFLSDDSGVQTLFSQGDAFPEGGIAGRAPALLAINNSGQVAMVFLEQGILLSDAGRLHWLARLGQSAVGFQATFSQVFDDADSYYFPPSQPFFNDRGEMVFWASLSDGRSGIFRASLSAFEALAVSGDPEPGRPGSTIDFPHPVRPFSRGTWVFFRAEAGATTVLLRWSAATGLGTLLREGDQPPEDLPAIGGIGTVEGNEHGAAAVQVYFEGTASALLVVNGTETQVVARPGQTLPGIPGAVTRLFPVTLDNQGRLLLLASSRQGAAFYLREGEELRKIVGDGDPSPLGGELDSISPICSLICDQFFEFTRMNESLEFAFGDSSGSVFIWRGGALEAIELPAEHPRLGDRLLTSSLPISVNARGSLLLFGITCCDGWTSAVLSTEPTGPGVFYVPFLAAGASGALEMETEIELANHSRFGGVATLEVFRRDGTPLRDPAQLPLPPGRTAAIGLTPFEVGELTTGYARVTVEGGAGVGVQTTLRLLGPQGLLSQTAVPATEPGRTARLVVGSDAAADTGVALTNPRDQPATIQLDLRSSGGNVVRSRELVLGPGEQSALFVTQLFDDMPQTFQGLLDLSADAPVVATGLRQAGLQLSQMPIAVGRLPETPATSIFSLFPSLPDPERPHQRVDIERIVTSPDGRVALLTEAPEAWLIDGPETVRVATPGMLLAGMDAPVSDGRRAIELIGFSPQGDLLVALEFESSIPGQRSGLFKWRGARLETVFLDNFELLDGTGGLFPRVQNRSGELLLTGSRGEAFVFVAYDGLDFRSLFEYPNTISVDSLSFGEDRRVAVLDRHRQQLWIFDEAGRTLVAEAGDIAGGRFFIDKLGRVDLAPGGRLFFSAVSTRKVDSGERATGLLLYDGQSLKTLLIHGDLVPGMERVVVNTLEESHTGFDDPGRARFQMNGSGEIIVRTELTSPVSNLFAGERRAFIHFDEQLQGRLIVPLPGDFSDAAPFALDRLPAFDWNDDGTLHFKAEIRDGASGHRDAVFRWKDGNITRIVAVGDRLPATRRAPLALLRSVHDPQSLDDGSLIFSGSPRGPAPSGLFLAETPARQRAYVPHVVAGTFPGVEYQTTLFLHNASNDRFLADVHLLNPAGALVRSFRGLRVQPHQTRRVSLELDQAFIGWAEIVVNGHGLEAFERFSVTTTAGELLSEVTVPALGLRAEGFWLGQAVAVESLDGGLAVANPYGVPIQVVVERLGEDLTVVEEHALGVSPRGHQARLFSELFPGSSGGLFRLRSEFPVPAITLRLDGVRITSQTMAP